MIRDARPDDAAAIGRIWNPVIRDTAITFWPTERSEAEIRAYVAAKQDAGHGCFVWDHDGILGFAAYGQFRNGGGYAHSMEHTIYTAPEARGLGIGAALLAHVEDHAPGRRVDGHDGISLDVDQLRGLVEHPRHAGDGGAEHHKVEAVAGQE